MSDYRQYLGNKCAFCGWCKIPKVLEFAHKRGTIKLFSIAHVMKKSKEHVIKEIEKCILLCPTCHRVYDLEGRTSAC